MGACQVCCVTRPFPDRLLSLTLLAFEGLNTAAGKDQCLACLEEAFFPPLWAPLLALYRYCGPRTGLDPPGPPCPRLQQPLASLPAGACTSPARRPWPGAWSGTGTPAPPTWGCPPGFSRRPLAALRTAPPSRTCASSRWRPVPAGSWSASVRDRGGPCWCGGWVGREGVGVTLGSHSVPQCEPCVASASVPRNTAAPGTAGPPPLLPCEYGG